MGDTVRFTTEEPYKNVKIVETPKRAIPPHATRWEGLENQAGKTIQFVDGQYETDDADEIALLATKPYVTEVVEEGSTENGDGEGGDGGDGDPP